MVSKVGINAAPDVTKQLVQVVHPTMAQLKSNPNSKGISQIFSQMHGPFTVTHTHSKWTQDEKRSKNGLTPRLIRSDVFSQTAVIVSRTTRRHRPVNSLQLNTGSAPTAPLTKKTTHFPLTAPLHFPCSSKLILPR